MIQRVYTCTLQCPEVTEVYVATDDERIMACVSGFGGKGIMTRPDHTSGTDRICEAAHALGLDGETIVINIQGDQPFFHPSLVSDLVKPFDEDGGVVMTTLKYRMPGGSDIQNPNHVKVVTDNQGFALYFSRYPIPFSRDKNGGQLHYKHLGFYGYRMDFLARFTQLPGGILESAEKLEQLRALEHGFKIKVEETPYNSVEVDVPQDIQAVESMLRDEKA
jgi:3-deoxy-manno-octulosonate cytidylyltransferase (CMP-KDO synthetase)